MTTYSISVILKNLKCLVLWEIMANLCQIIIVCAIKTSEFQNEEYQKDERNIKYVIDNTEISGFDRARFFHGQDVDFKQTWDLISPDKMVMLSSNAFATQIFIAAGWLVSGKIYMYVHDSVPRAIRKRKLF